MSASPVMRAALAAAAALVLLVPAAANAARDPTPAERDLIVATAHDGVISGICELMGFTGVAQFQAEVSATILREAKAAGLQKKVVAHLYNAQIDEEVARYLTPAGLPKTDMADPVAFYLGMAEACQQLDLSPRYGQFIAAPANFRPRHAAAVLVERVRRDSGGALSTTPTQAQFDRANALAYSSLVAANCRGLGFTLESDGSALGAKTIAGFRDEAAETPLSPEAADALLAQALDRQGKTIEIDIAGYPATAEGYRALNLRLADDCLKAAQDPVLAGILKAPEGFEPRRAAAAATDVLLAKGGLASWQTPSIQARGDLLTVAGSCRRLIGGERADALFKTYARAEDPRERAYYVESYDAGLADKFHFDFDLAQCERAIATNIKTAGAVPAP